MPEATKQKGDKESQRLAAIDRMLLAAVQQGPVKKSAAINRILELVPHWTRGNCWKRIRYLRKNLASNNCDDHGKGKDWTSKPPGAATRSSGALWTPADDDTLFRLAGYEPVNRIAQRLGRSVPAIRFRLGALGMSARVTDGWSLRALRKLLRVGPARLRYLVGSGLLRVRDPRVTLDSFSTYCEKNSASLNASTLQRIAAVLASAEAAFSCERTAELLGVTAPQVRELISSGQLKLVDWFVTDKSFEDFSKKHGSEINMALLDPLTTKWLHSEYGVLNAAANTVNLSRAQKHALITRTCVCGRNIAGNSYFRHIRACRAADRGADTLRSNVLDSSTGVLVVAQSPRSTKPSAALHQSSKGG